MPAKWDCKCAICVRELSHLFSEHVEVLLMTTLFSVSIISSTRRRIYSINNSNTQDDCKDTYSFVEVGIYTCEDYT